MNVVVKFLAATAGRKDLIVIVLTLVAIAMMMLPMPEIILDFFLAINITVSVALLITTFYLSSPSQIATFPSLLLISTLMRMAASVASTRLILLYGEAGDIIVTFGNFIVNGNLTVGIVVFLILTVVNFMVITKGSERVAEVSARFTLDAMPGKQMSIDAELKSGDIDKPEAMRRREELQIESQFFGSMDGAMKFVKGDSIAGIIILVINMLGGLIIGTTMMGMTAGEAAEKFAILSIGDGLVGQIPSLLISVGAGLIITRITSSKSKDIGQDILRELVYNPKTSAITFFVLIGMGFIPGFPKIVFFSLAAIFGAIAYKAPLLTLYNKRILKKDDYVAPSLIPDPEGEDDKAPAGATKVEIFIDENLLQSINIDALLKQLRAKKNEFVRYYGVKLPPISKIKQAKLRENFFIIELDGIPVAEGELQLGSVLVRCDHTLLDVATIPYELAPPMGNVEKQFWVKEGEVDKLKSANISYMTLSDTVIDVVSECFRRNLGVFLGLQEVQDWLNDAGRTYPDMVNEIRQAIQPQKLMDVFKRLLGDGISLAGRRPLLEALLNWAGREEDPAMLAELIRVTLRRRICFTYANENKVMVAAIFDPSLEDIIRKSIRRTNMGDFLALDEPTTQSLLGHIKQLNSEPRFMSPTPIVLCSIDLRRFVRGFLIKHGIDLPVLSHQDIAEDFTVQVIYAIK